MKGNIEHPTSNAERRMSEGPQCLPLPAKIAARVRVGDVAILRLDNGQLWLVHARGEGAAVKEQKLATLLEEFFWREF